MAAALTNFLTVGQVAEHFRVAPWKVGRLFERGLLPSPTKVGPYRVVAESDLAAVECALRRGGYLPEAVPECQG